jgi:DNA-binding response OmpR family regulator
MDDTAPHTSGTMDASERRQRGRKHVFVVNGASEFLDVVRMLLEDESYNVTTTNFVPETFGLILALDPALIIIDLAIHIQSGWDLLEQLQRDALTHALPVIVVSTNPTYLEKVQADSARYGGQRFLGKPFDIAVLLAAVEELIGKA